MEETFHTIKKTENNLKQLKFHDKQNQLKVERVGSKRKMKVSALSYSENLFKKLK
jgi:hypothetical protein